MTSIPPNSLVNRNSNSFRTAVDQGPISWQAAAQRAILYYGEGKEQTLKEKRELEARDGRFEARLTGLGPATTYRYRIALLEDGKPRIYTKGTFILHLNGIDRQQSASYYTPEVLTQCLVEEAHV